MIDSHCHLDDRKFGGEVPRGGEMPRHGEVSRMVDEANRVGVHTIVTIGTDLATSEKAVSIAHQFSSVYATVGTHPHDARKFDERVLDRFRELASSEKKIRAIGEIGLDYYRDLSPRPIQKKVFEAQLKLAVEVGLPVVIHTRESFEDTLAMTKEFARDLKGGVFHCFPGSIDDAMRVFELGFVISVGGVITYPNSGMARMVAEVPLEKVLLETDAPYLTPVPHRGKVNAPAYIPYIRDKLAEIRGISPAEVEKITDRNSRKFFGLSDVIEG
jgi:TatD DNase family protein